MHIQDKMQVQFIYQDSVLYEPLDNQLTHLPRTNNFVYIKEKRYQVTSNVFDYDKGQIRIHLALA